MAKKHTILFLAGNPIGTDPLALGGESREIKRALERSSYRDCFDLEVCYAAQPDDLLDQIRKLKPTVVHFSGHGTDDGTSVHQAKGGRHRDIVDAVPHFQSELTFHGANGYAQVVSIEAVTNTFGAAGASVKLVVLSACCTETQAEALLAHVDCAVGMAGSIQDDAARHFASAFYGGLGDGVSVERAFAQGKAAIQLHGRPGSDCPQLKVRPGVDAGRLVLGTDRAIKSDAASTDTDTPSADDSRLSPSPPPEPTAPRWDIDFNDLIKMAANDPWCWTVVLSKDEALRYGELMSSLQRDEGDAGLRFIDSGFAYWGVGPTIQWRSTCKDDLYVVMKKGIDTFHGRWRLLLESLPVTLPSIYVSYGVGTGDKDRIVLGALNTSQVPPAYVPIDMSLDMLVQGAKTASRGVLGSNRLIPLQVDFSSPAELITVNEIRKSVLGNRSILFSLLGNTLANFDNDVTTLSMLTELMRDDDLMVLELATTRAVDPMMAARAAGEYSAIPSFDTFVRSALTQHTDLPPNRTEYHGEECHDGEALQIDMSYVSPVACRSRLINGTFIELKPREKIRLYRSRKYTHAAIRRILSRAGLAELGHFQWDERRSPFGMYLGMCRKSRTPAP